MAITHKLPRFFGNIVHLISYPTCAKNKLKRQWLFFKQRREKGFDDSETWSLDYQISKFALPRLKRFREITIACPFNPKTEQYLTKEEWQQILGDIELFLRYYSLVDDPGKQSDLRKIPNFEERFLNGKVCWGEYFGALWW